MNNQTVFRPNALYYPYINVPENDWFIRVLLYWDNVCSIVPMDYSYNRSKLKPFMIELLDAELVKPVLPLHYVNRIDNFIENFIIHSEKFLEKKHSDNIEYTPTHFTKIHIEKLGHLGNELCKMGLAQESNYPWYLVESSLANDFMLYLASLLSELPQINSRPITDSINELPGNNFNRHRLILDEVLPSPGSIKSVEELKGFKNKNSESLRRFRSYIESNISNISLIKNSEERNDFLNDFKKQVKEDINTIVGRMNEHGWHKINKDRLISYSLIAGGISSAVISGNPMDLILSGIGVLNEIRTRRNETEIYSESGNYYVTYAALAQRKFGK